MNRVYQVIWNRSKGVWQAASELSHSSRGSASGAGSVAGSLKTISAGAILLIALPLHASDLPSGGTIVGGQGSINSSGKTLTVNQSSQNMAVNWQDFSIAEGHTVNFNQPNAQAAALNRVTGNNVSDIRGALNANGRVFLVNPNGVMFSSTARVDVGSLVTSTLDISTDDFMAGNYRFEGASANAIINQGNITTAEGGVVAMIAAEIINTGRITTPQGSTLMGAGNKVTLDLGGPLKIEVEEALLDTYIEQGGAIRADGGLVYLTARAAGELASSVINHTGVTEARTLATGEDGRIMLMGDMDSGRVEVAGTLDASAPAGGDGGSIETSAAKVVIGDVYVTTRADNGQTGEWLIDPNDYTIAASGGDMTGAQLGTNLADTDVTIASIEGSDANGNGDIFVNDDVTWSSGNTLTLNAIRNIEINSTLDASGGSGGKLVLEYGQGAATSGNTATYNINAPVNLQAGQNFSTRLGNDGAVIDYTVITELGAEGSITGTDLQGINGNLSGNYALGSDIDASETSGWNNGAGWNPIGDWFSGNFDGLGHTIDSIYIDRPTEMYVGFFGDIWNADISNLGIINAEIKAESYAGILAGGIGDSTVSNVFSSGNVSLVHPWGYVAGGLLGFVRDSSISQSHSSASVSGKDYIGGLVGELKRSSIDNSYAIGSATGVRNESEASYMAGGLVGRMEQSSIKNSYAAGAVSADFDSGGLVGRKGHSSDSAENSYWDITASGQTTSAVGTGKTTAEMYSQSTYVNWDAAIWSYAVGQAADGYEVGLPSLTNVTRIEDRPTTTLFEGGMGTVDNEYTITNWNQLQNINYNIDLLTGNYYFSLSNDLDVNTVGYNEQASASANGGLGWNPIGRSSDFKGNFDGLGNSLESLVINHSGENNIGLFSQTNQARIQNIQLLNTNVLGRQSVGGLIGDAEDTHVGNVSVSGIITGQDTLTGGLIGRAINTHVENSSTSGTVTGYEQVGGLVGYMLDAANTVLNSSSSSTVSGERYVGGLVGDIYSSSIRNSYATGDVSGGTNSGDIGGLVGRARDSSIDQTYATGDVNGVDATGGLVGTVQVSTAITNSYSTGDVIASFVSGGLVGSLDANSSVSNSYALTSNLQGMAGGLIGMNGDSSFGNVTHSFWDTKASGVTNSRGGDGKTTAELQTASTFNGWDLSVSGGSNNVWRLYEGNSSPLLRSFMTVATVSSGNDDALSKTYDGTTAINNQLLELDWQVADNSAFNSNLLLGSGFRLDNENVGTRNLVSGYHSGQQGYDIVVDSNLGKRQMEVTAAKSPRDDNPTEENPTEDNPALNSAIQSAQQAASAPVNPTTGSFGSAAGMTDISLSGAAQSGGLEVVELDGNSSNTIIEGQSSQGIGPLQMFVIDGGISLAEDS